MYISNKFPGTNILITNGCVASHPKLTGLKQRTFIISQPLWVRSLGECGGQLSVRAVVSFESLSEGGSASKITCEVIGGIQ